MLSTGDELVSPTETPKFGQVRDANSALIFGALREMGATPVMAGIVRDDVESLRETIFSFEIQADAFVSSGGVSVGERDVVKAAFFRRGDVDFYKVAMQPGMPQGFGHVEGKPYFGLPGNPVSVFVSLEVFLRPAILKMMGRTHLYRPEVTATLTEDVTRPPREAPVRPGRGPAGPRWVVGHADRRPWLEPDLHRRAGERARDDPGGHRRRTRRLHGEGHVVPVVGGLR